MRLAIIHHHLNRGGVSQVIGNHLRSLFALSDGLRPERVALIYDGQADSWPENEIRKKATFPIDPILIESIGYDQSDSAPQPQRLADRIESELIAAGYSPQETILHWHNHSLGKNASVPDAIKLLALRGWRILLQVHDFAEDNRPANYLHLQDQLGAKEVSKTLYPRAENIHYATLTSRDALVLDCANVDQEQLSILPNPVLPFTLLPSRKQVRSKVLEQLSITDSDTRLLVYPVRGIRRKNVGEMLLLSALSKERTTPSCFAITLAPKNPSELESFKRWQQLAEELELPCRFDTGGTYQVDFFDLLTSADAILTTSIAEGFGMVFMEAWLLDKPLVGRDLPDITTDFKQAGIHLDNLYQELAIPCELIDLDSVFTALIESYQDLRKAYKLDAESSGSIRKAYEQTIQDGTIDFARLPSDHQRTVIDLANRDSAVRQLILEKNPTEEIWLASYVRDQQTIEQNKRSVLAEYNEASIGDRLHQAYSSLLTATISAEVNPADGNRVLDWFVTPEKIIPIRIES